MVSIAGVRQDANDLKPADHQNNIASPHLDTRVAGTRAVEPGHNLVTAYAQARGPFDRDHRLGLSECALSTQNTNVSVFPNLETSEWLGRAAGGRGAPGIAQRPTAKPISCCVQKLSLKPGVWIARKASIVYKARSISFSHSSVGWMSSCATKPADRVGSKASS